VTVSSTPYASGSMLFQSKCMEQTKAFSVTCLPQPLRTIVIPSLDEYGMPNYSKYLKRSLILEDSIMLPFLAILKDHLEEYQVFLGNVESWLMENTGNTIFLEKTFNVTLAICKGIGQKYLHRAVYPLNNNSQYDLSFDIRNDKGRAELTKFLAFISDVE